ncbi:MAG: hypothetical protein IKE48_02150 [Parasporobacterium sp.]|nr:hypothetical protein [Parasporobacterium sp.]
MDNRPIGREKRVISGGSGIKRSGEGLGKTTSARNIRKPVQDSPGKSRGFFSSLFRKKS